MSDFAEVMQTDPPRMVVLWRRTEDGTDQFQWGVVGNIPLLSLVGAVIQIQSDMANQLVENSERLTHHNECPEQAFVMAYDGQDFAWWVSRSIPMYPLVGMLETIKAALVGSRQGQRTVAEKVILGPDGNPIRNKRMA